MSYTYPALDTKSINLIIQLYESFPDYFDSPDCPYPDTIKDLFRGELAYLDFDSHDTKSSNPLTDDEIIKNISDIHSKLQNYWNDVKNSDKGSDKNTFFRVSVALLEKLVSLRKEMSGIKHANQFIAETMTIMEDVLSADQRNEVMERLEKFDQRSQ